MIKLIPWSAPVLHGWEKLGDSFQNTFENYFFIRWKITCAINVFFYLRKFFMSENDLQPILADIMYSFSLTLIPLSLKTDKFLNAKVWDIFCVSTE